MTSASLRRNLVVDEATSSRMRAVRRRGTEPELLVRQILTGLGLRYRVDNRDLPGSPDVANRTRQWAVFVHGCFWHGHRNCRRATVPRRNRAFWVEKLNANRLRDRRAAAALRKAGFTTVIVWQCELDRIERLGERLERLLGRAAGDQ